VLQRERCIAARETHLMSLKCTSKLHEVQCSIGNAGENANGLKKIDEVKLYMEHIEQTVWRYVGKVSNSFTEHWEKKV